MIEHEKEKHGWEFLFLAANIDAVETASHIGIMADRSVDYMADSCGTELAFNTVAETVCSQRMGMPIRASWSKKVKEDHQKRKK